MADVVNVHDLSTIGLDCLDRPYPNACVPNLQVT